MTPTTQATTNRLSTRYRTIAWSSAALLLLLPLVAMQFTNEVNWDGSDFAVFAAMLIGAGGGFELAVRRTGNAAYRAAVGVALATAFVLIWMTGAVGIIGSENIIALWLTSAWLFQVAAWQSDGGTAMGSSRL